MRKEIGYYMANIPRLILYIGNTVGIAVILKEFTYEICQTTQIPKSEH